MARFTNQAQLRYGNAVANSNIAVGEILEVLSATKTAVRKTYRANDSITYVISIVNAGDTSFAGLILNDTLGSYPFGTTTLTPLTYVEDSIKYYINGILQAPLPVTAGPPLSINDISVPARGNVTIIYETALNEFAPVSIESEITNTAVITGGLITSITPITVDETVEALSEPILSITKSVSPVPVTENGTLTYTFLIQNTGNTAAEEADSLTVTDTFDPRLTNLSVSFNGKTWSDPANYTYDETTGVFSTVAGQITVPAATFEQNTTTGGWIVTPGTSTLVVTGTIKSAG